MVNLTSKEIKNIRIPVCSKKVNMCTVCIVSSIATLFALFSEFQSGVYMGLKELYTVHTATFFIEMILVYFVLSFSNRAFGIKEIQFENGNIALISGPVTQVTTGATVVVDDRLDSKFVAKLKEDYVTSDPVMITLLNDGGSKNFVVDRENVKELCEN